MKKNCEICGKTILIEDFIDCEKCGKSVCEDCIVNQSLNNEEPKMICVDCIELDYDEDR